MEDKTQAGHMPKRYDPELSGPCPELNAATMEECTSGDYVKFEDYAALRSLHAELLDALRDCVEMIEDAGWHRSCVETARAAIAKAEGEWK